MAIFLDQIEDSSLIRTICFPKKTNRLDIGTMLYIPTTNQEKLINILDNVRGTRSNFRFRMPKQVYSPLRISPMLGVRSVPFKNMNVVSELKNIYRPHGITMIAYDPKLIGNYNGIVDYTELLSTVLPKVRFTRANILTLWKLLLTNISQADTTNILLWTPDNVSSHIITAGGVRTEDWRNLDFYKNFLWQIKYNFKEFRAVCRKNDMKILWTDYRYSYYVDLNDPKYDGLESKGIKVLTEWLMGVKRLKLSNNIVDIDESTDEATDSVKEAVLGDAITPSINDKIQPDEVAVVIEEEPVSTDEVAIDGLTKDVMDATDVVEFPDELLEMLKDVSKSKKSVDFEGEARKVLAIIDKSQKKNTYIPPRLAAVTKEQDKTVETSLSKALKDMEDDFRNVIEAKTYDVNGVFDTFKIKDMDKQYRQKKAIEDRMNVLSSLANSEKPLFLTNYKATDSIDNPDAKLKKIQVTYQTPEDAGTSHTFTFNVPTLRDDKFLYLGNSDKVMARQKIALPIVRLKNDVVFTTYYNKMFVRPSSGNVSRKIYKLKKFIKALRREYDSRQLGTWIVFTPTIEISQSNNHYYEELVEVTRYISRIDIDPENYLDLSATTNEVGKLNGVTLYASDREDILHDAERTVEYDYLQFISALMFKKNDKKILQMWEDAMKGRGTDSIMYTICTAAYAKIPTLYVILHALDYDLNKLLERLKKEYDLGYQIIPNTMAVNKISDINEMDDIEFKDFTLRIKYNNLANRILLSRLLAHDFSEIESLDLEPVISDEFTKSEEMNLCNLRDLFIDPITKDVMDSIGIPSDYVGALIYANALLFNYERPISEISLKNERMPSNAEIIEGTIYKVISQHYSDYVKKVKNGVNVGKVKFAIPPDAVVKKLQESPAVSESSKLNPVSHVYGTLSVSNKGLEGLGVNEDRAYTVSKRLWDDTFYGVISDVSPYNKNTGMNKQLVINPNITDIRGFFNASPEDVETLDASQTMSVSEGLGAFAQKHDASPRTAMGMSQFNHLMPVNDAEPALVTYGFDESLSYLDSDFVIRAKGSGKITAISKDYIKVKYDDPELGEEVYAMNAIVRNAEKAFYIPNEMKVSGSLKTSMTVKEDTVLMYNIRVYEEFDEGIPIFKSGPIVNVAIAHTQNSYEDSALISQHLADRLATKVIKHVAVVLKSTDRIGGYAKIDHNTQINAGDLLIQYLESDGVSLNGLFGDTSVSLSDVLSKKILSHYQGYLRDIYVYTKLDEKSLKKIDKSVKEFINYVEHYYDANESTGKFRTNNITDNNRVVEHVIHYPVSKTIKVNKILLEKGDILVEFYIEVDQAFSSGDKITFGNTALKGVCSKVLQNDERPYGAKTGKVVDAIVSPISPLARMVYSFFLNGVLSLCVVKANEDIQQIINGGK